MGGKLKATIACSTLLETALLKTPRFQAPGFNLELAPYNSSFVERNAPTLRSNPDVARVLAGSAPPAAVRVVTGVVGRRCKG